MKSNLSYRFAEGLMRFIKKTKSEGPDIFFKNLHETAVLCNSEKNIYSYLVHPKIKLETKKALINLLSTDSLVRKLLVTLVITKKLELLEDILAHFNLLKNREQQIIDVQLELTTPLENSQEKLLRQSLEKYTGKKVNLQSAINNTLLGGISIRIGDKIIDNSIKARLNKLREEILR